MSQYDPDCLFCKIVRGTIPATIVYRNDHVLAFSDISPVAPQHVLIIPVIHIASLSELGPQEAEIAGQLLLAARIVAEKTGVLESGYRLVFNNGKDAMQSVAHYSCSSDRRKNHGMASFSRTRGSTRIRAGRCEGRVVLKRVSAVSAASTIT